MKRASSAKSFLAGKCCRTVSFYVRLAWPRMKSLSRYSLNLQVTSPSSWKFYRLRTGRMVSWISVHNLIQRCSSSILGSSCNQCKSLVLDSSSCRFCAWTALFRVSLLCYNYSKLRSNVFTLFLHPRTHWVIPWLYLSVHFPSCRPFVLHL